MRATRTGSQVVPEEKLGTRVWELAEDAQAQMQLQQLLDCRQ